jgi:hypothetical protein
MHLFQQTQSLQDQLTSFAKEAREVAAKLRPGLKRDDLIRRARQADTAAHIDDWINSAGLQPPTWLQKRSGRLLWQAGVKTGGVLEDQR